MIEYLPMEEVREASGLRLVLSPGRPGGWTESAKNLCHVKGLTFVAAAQEVNSDNLPLKDWTLQTAAPVVAFNDETPKTSWIEQLFLFERLAPEPRLVPTASADRAILFGLAAELCAEDGFGWCRRLMILHDVYNDPNATEGELSFTERMAGKYGYTEAKAKAAPARCADILSALSRQLASQQAKGKRYLVGDALSALDIYWASFCALVQPLPHEQCAMNDWFRTNYTLTDPVARAGASDALIAHRDAIYRDHLKLPVEL